MSTQTVTVKIHDAKKVISTFQVTKTHDQPVIIQAKANLNYELVDDMTQFAPENIKIQRVGQDLHIAFEDADGLPNDPDLIITNYYQANGGSSNLLIGLSENGSYYAYVPESGLQEGAVSMLADQITSAQALGGEALVPAAFAFNPWWLLGLSPLAAVGGGGGGGGGGGDTTAPTVTSIVMSDTQLKSGETSIVTITFSEAVTGFDNTDVTVENGTLSTLTSNDGGITWTGIFTPTADIEDTTNIITVANTYTDAAGNGGTGAISENYEIDTKPPTAILTIDPITDDNIVNASEAGGMVTVTGSV
ncbi:Ig-like domain-containing protein, partial [Acinetobacter sp. CAAS 2-6]|uniref:Ig-like domain-containing protein n=1 Tax=Acinetobacter sp. CAAS 2-6 TaxID=3016358 RepID=UPI002DD6911A